MTPQQAYEKRYSRPWSEAAQGVQNLWMAAWTIAWVIAEGTEREACAKVCEGLTGRSYEFDMGRLHSAAAIRARSNHA